jgi:hypothetical protein
MRGAIQPLDAVGGKPLNQESKNSGKFLDA